MSMNGGDNTTLAPGQHWELEDLALYALELLPAGERDQIDLHLASDRDGSGSGCAICLEELWAVREDLGIYALGSVEAVEVPAGARERLLSAIGQPGAGSRGPQAAAAIGPSSSPGVQPASDRLELLPGVKPALAASTRVPAWLGWAVAAAMALVATHFYQQNHAAQSSLSAQSAQIAQLSADEARARLVVDALTDRGAQRVTLSLTKGGAPPQPYGRATYNASTGALLFVAGHLQPVPAGKAYELWIIPADGGKPIPTGTFQPDARGDASLILPKLQRATAAKAFGVTIEAAGGAESPTLPILLAGS